MNTSSISTNNAARYAAGESSSDCAIGSTTSEAISSQYKYSCLSPEREDPWENEFAVIAPRVSGCLSAICSLLIIFVIFRSRARVGTIYHRIMLGLSIADIMGSLAMALTSLPMPSEMPLEKEIGYHWAGTRLGNTHTCNAQGFFAVFGIVTMFAYNVSLCLYYACAISMGMKEVNIKKYIEVVLLHGFPISSGLLSAVLPLFYDMYNPSIANVSWCFAQSYPLECEWRESVDCIRGAASMTATYAQIGAILLFFTVIVISLLSVNIKVRQTDRIIKSISKSYTHHPSYKDIVKRHNNSKVILIQSLAYVLTFLLTLLLPMLRGAIFFLDGRGPKVASTYDKLMLFMLPMQGCLNFVIFVSHKVHGRMRVDESVSAQEAFLGLFSSMPIDPCYISRIVMVSVAAQDPPDDRDSFDNRDRDLTGIDTPRFHRTGMINLQLEDEDGEIVSFCCNPNKNAKDCENLGLSISNNCVDNVSSVKVDVDTDGKLDTCGTEERALYEVREGSRLLYPVSEFQDDYGLESYPSTLASATATASAAPSESDETLRERKTHHYYGNLRLAMSTDEGAGTEISNAVAREQA